MCKMFEPRIKKGQKFAAHDGEIYEALGDSFLWTNYFNKEIVYCRNSKWGRSSVFVDFLLTCEQIDEFKVKVRFKAYKPFGATRWNDPFRPSHFVPSDLQRLIGEARMGL